MIILQMWVLGLHVDLLLQILLRQQLVHHLRDEHLLLHLLSHCMQAIIIV